MIAPLLLAACAGPTYYPAQASGEGGYYIARSPGASVVALHDAASAYSTFPVYGIYPWWSYSYYSPYLYPHHFSIWQPGWPWYGGGFWAWHGSYPNEFSYWGGHADGWPRHRPPAAVTPGHASPMPPVAPPTVWPEPGHAATARELYREQARWREARGRAGYASAERRAQPLDRPSTRVNSARPFEPPAAAASMPGSASLPMPAAPSSPGRTVHSREPLGRAPLQRDP